MGSNISSIKNLKDNPYLVKLVGEKNVSENDSAFWNEFLSFAMPNLDELCSDPKFIEDNIVPLASKWMDNNLVSNNFGTLIHVLAHKLRALQQEKPDTQNYNIIIWHAFNLLFMIRTMFKYLIETVTEETILKHCRTASDTPKGNSAPVAASGDEIAAEESSTSGDMSGIKNVRTLIHSLTQILLDVPLSDSSYFLHVEACKSFLILLSVQMYSPKSSSQSSIFSLVMSKTSLQTGLMLTRTLLDNFVQQKPAPDPGTGSLIFGLASGIWNILTLGYANAKTDEEIKQEAILARVSLLLLLVLTNHCTKDNNPYRKALFQFRDIRSKLVDNGGATVTPGDSQVDDTEQASKLDPKLFQMNFGHLYESLCTTLNDEQTTLLLYMLLHQNANFKLYVLSKSSDMADFVIPVLKILYNSIDRNSHHIYMALIILLILTEDNLFNNTVHDIYVKNLTWYTERNLNEISLGGLIVLVIARTIQFNMSRSRDKFLHTNLCATLANMSNHFKNLSTVVCQKLMNLCEKISKKYIKILQQIELAKLAKQNGIDQNKVEGSDATMIELVKDFPVFDEVIRTVLEVINTCLTKNMGSNPNLVYTLLYDKRMFDDIQSIPNFQDILINIETVLTFFSNRINATERVLSVEEVLDIIRDSSMRWPSEKLKKFPELKFRYVEDEQPEDFFIPYIWQLVFRCSNIFWSSKNILLFNPVCNA